MSDKSYQILLNNKLLGTTKLEFGDPPMGVVFGKIVFAESNIGYQFLKQYCIDNSIEIQSDDPDERVIFTAQIPNLKIYNSANIEISGMGSNIEGMDADGYTVTIYGVDGDIYQQEFPEHIAEYEQKCNNGK